MKISLMFCTIQYSYVNTLILYRTLLPVVVCAYVNFTCYFHMQITSIAIESNSNLRNPRSEILTFIAFGSDHIAMHISFETDFQLSKNVTFEIETVINSYLSNNTVNNLEVIGFQPSGKYITLPVTYVHDNVNVLFSTNLLLMLSVLLFLHIFACTDVHTNISVCNYICTYILY